ncbi:unnamed protein product [Closterium sp. NIES-54]
MAEHINVTTLTQDRLNELLRQLHESSKEIVALTAERTSVFRRGAPISHVVRVVCSERIDRYIGGLKHDIAQEIQLRGVTDFQEILAMAEKLDFFRRSRPGPAPGPSLARARPSLRGVPPSPLPPPMPLLLLLQTSLYLRTPGLLLLVRSATAARARVAGVVVVAAAVVEVAAGGVVGAAVEVVAAVGLLAGVGALVAVVEATVGVAAVEAVGLVAVGVALVVLVLEVASVSSSSVGARLCFPSSFTCGWLHTQHRCFSRLHDAWRAEFGDDVELPRWTDLLKSRIAIFDLDFDAILSAMYALSTNVEGDCYRCVPPDPEIAVAALGASESCTLPGTAPAEALHTLTLDSGASHCFFCDITTLTPLPAPVPVRVADPSGGPAVARSSTVLPCPAFPSGSLSSLHLPSFSTNLVSTAALQDAMVTTTTPGGQRVSICTCTRTGRHLATFTRRPGSSLYILTTEPSQVAASAQVSAPDQVAASCSSPPLLPPSPAPPCLPCVEGRQHSAPHSSFPPTTAPLQTLHMDDLPVLRLHSDRGGEFSSTLLREFCHGEGILQTFTLPDSPQQNGIAERRIGLVMEVARTSMIHAAAPHFLWPFAVRYAAHKLNLWPHVSLPETSPTLRWTGEVGDASVFRFYHPTSRRVFPSQDVMFDESVPFYCLFPYCSAPPPPPPLFLAPGPPPVDPLPPQGPSPSGVSQVDPLPGPAPVHVVGAETGGAEPGGVGTGGSEPEGVEPGGAASEGSESGGVEPQGATLSGGSAGASPRISPQQLREWFVRRARLRSGATGAGAARGAGAAGAGGTGVFAGAGGTGGPEATVPGGARTRGTGAAGLGGVEGAGARNLTGSGTGAVDFGAGGAGGTVRPRPYFVPLLQQVLGTLSSTGPTPPFLCPLPDQSQPPLQPASPLPAPSPYIEQSGGLTERREPASRPVSPVCTARRAPRSRPPPVPGTHAMTLRPSSLPLRVPLPAPPASSLPEVPDHASDRARAASPTVSCLLATVVTDPSFESAAAFAPVAGLLDFAAACRLDYTTALVAESASASPPFVGGECALGTDVLEDRQEDFECLAAAVPRFASLLLAPEGDPDAPDIPTPRSYAEAITGTQWSLRRPVYGLRQAPREWHDMLRTTLAALGFAPSTADPSLFLRTDTSLPPFYVLVYVNDLVFATADTEALTLVKSELQKRHTCTDLGELRSHLGLQITRDRARCTITLTLSDMVHQVLHRFGFQFSSPHPTPLSTSHSLLAPPSDESVEPNGMYPELVGCLMYVMTCTRPDLAYRLSLLARYVAPGRHRKTPQLRSGRHKATPSVLVPALCRGGLLARLQFLAQAPRSPPILYVDNKSMIALCQQHRLEHRTKHIALQYFLARELQQRGHLHLAYVATRANTADVFTKALPPGDHQRFVTLLGLVPTLPHLLTA